MSATKAALASAKIAHCCFRCGLRMFQRPPDRLVAGSLDDVRYQRPSHQQQAPTSRTLQHERGRARSISPRRREDPRGGVQSVTGQPASTLLDQLAHRPLDLAMLVSSATAIRLSLQPQQRPKYVQAQRGCRELISSWAERLPLGSTRRVGRASLHAPRPAAAFFADSNLFPPRSPPSLPAADKIAEFRRLQ